VNFIHEFKCEHYALINTASISIMDLNLLDSNDEELLSSSQ